MEPARKLPREVRSPAIDCPKCGILVYVNDSVCWRCFTRFGENELRTRWENAEHHP